MEQGALAEALHEVIAQLAKEEELEAWGVCVGWGGGGSWVVSVKKDSATVARYQHYTDITDEFRPFPSLHPPTNTTPATDLRGIP